MLIKFSTSLIMAIDVGPDGFVTAYRPGSGKGYPSPGCRPNVGKTRWVQARRQTRDQGCRAIPCRFPVRKYDGCHFRWGFRVFRQRLDLVCLLPCTRRPFHAADGPQRNTTHSKVLRDYAEIKPDRIDIPGLGASRLSMCSCQFP